MAQVSASATAAAVSAIPAEGMEPPQSLTREEATEWRSIVSGLLPGHFGSANSPLLAQLCRHVVIARQLAEQLRTMRHTPLTLTTARGAKRRDLFCLLARAAIEESRTIMALSVKLRLCNSSYRLTAVRDERASRVVSMTPRPWEGH